MDRCLVVLLLGLGLLVPRVAVARATRWHADVDMSYMRGSLRFVNVPAYSVQCLEMDCRVLGVDRIDVARATLGLGYGVLTFEGAVAFAAKGGMPYRSFTAGLRLQTSADAPIALAFRFAYVRSCLLGLEGQGGRAAVGLVLRFHHAFQLYAEASIEATTVPAVLQKTGTLMSYTPLVGLGVRMSAL